jgi:hypothetical protein
MLADVEYFNSRISKLEGVGDLGEHVFNVVRAKAVISEASAAKRSSIEEPQEEMASPAPAPAASSAGTT